MDENGSADEPDRHDTLPHQDISSHSQHSPTNDSSSHDDAATHDADHLNDVSTQDNNNPHDDIPSAAPNNSIVVACQNHDRNVTEECATILHDDDDDDDEKMMIQVSEGSSPSRLTELNRRSFFSSMVGGGAQSQKPVAVVSPMRQSASSKLVTSENVERQRPRSRSKLLSSGMMCQTSQTFNLGDSSSPRSSPGVADGSASLRRDLCASSSASTIDLLPSLRSEGLGGAQSSLVFFRANQEQFRKFDRPVATQTNELDLLQQSNFFYGHLSRSKVKAKLRHSEDGTFLVRFSSDPMFPFALSIKTPNGVTSVRLTRTPTGHIRLDCDPGQADRMPAFPSVLDLVVNYVRDEGTGRRARRSNCIYLEGVGLSETVLDLRKPFEESPASLGHLCRRRINALVPTFRRWNLIETLVQSCTPKDNVRNLIEFLDAYPYRV